MRIWRQITHGSVERGRQRGAMPALAVLLCALAFPSPGHGETTPAFRNFDHITTGFELLGQHRYVPCEACHANALFKGTPTACGACHGIGTAVRATAKPATHILSTDQCQACHTPWSWNPAVDFDHTQALGSCSTCHNGVQAPGRGPTHIQTDLECDVCHTTLSWAGAVFSHVGITSGCASCHNGVNAQGMVATHIPINGAGGTPTPCEGCHSPTNYVAWGPGTLINHAAVTTMQCAACHETAAFYGMHPSTNTAAGDSRPNATLDANHPTTGDCGVCHNTQTFAGAASKPPNHIPTTAPCIQCHTNPAQNSSYSVTGVHQGVTACLACHGPTVAGTFLNVTIVTTPATHMPIGALDCNGSGCHTTTNVNPGGFIIGPASTSSPTLTVAGHATVAGAVAACQTCHETAPYVGMLASTTSSAGDSRPPAALDANHPTAGDCGGCHTTTPTFANDQTISAEPANHIPTSAPCTQCHTTAGNDAVYSLTGTHQGVTGCLSCHGPTVGPFLNVTMVTTPANHFPVGSLDCNGSGCHTTTNVNPGGFKLGAASLSSPTLTIAGHATAATAVPACQTCHETAPYTGMIAGSASAAGDSRPSATLDANHPATGDCGGCHTTTPTFANDQTISTLPANHIPTSAPCAQCHTTPGNDAVYSLTGTHQGVTGCLSCHGPTVGPFANVTMVTSSANHFPIGTLDCNGSGCHTTTNVNPGGFKLGTASLASPTLTIAGHATAATAVSACQTCHETAPYTGMLASTATSAGDSRPPAALDAIHPATGDCGSCHTTTPTFATDQTGNAKPANHIPTTAACAQCHTTAGNYTVYSLTGTHQGVTDCLSCHGPTVGPFVNVTMVTTPANHFAVGALDCNGSGCHSTSNVNPGGFKLGTASLSSPTLTVAGHATVATAVAACATCHEAAPYMGMLVGSATAWGDSRPTAYDSLHPTTGDCGSCHTTTPTFASDMTAASKPANHIPTTAPCTQCHTTASNYAAYSVTATHQGVADCLSCHGPTVGPFANVTMVTTPGNHFPIATLDCNGSGCHTTTNVSPGGFKLGTANISSPTLTAAGHTTVQAAVAACATCHETAAYLGMTPSTAAPGGDSRPGAYDPAHPTTGDCGNCHVTTPTFATNLLPTAPKPANHIPTSAVCAQCHTTTGNFAVYDVTGVHQGITGGCAQCHGSGTGPFAGPPPSNLITIVGWPGSSHVPVGTADCSGSGCHTTTNVNPGGFKIGAANASSPTLTVAGHATIAAAGVAGCQTCHETAPYTGMVASTATAWGDSRPTAYDTLHPTSGDCGSCHTTTPTFASDMTASSKPSNHIPTTAACTQCHTTANNYASYSVTGTHQGVTACLSCHGPTVGPFANVTLVTTSSSHMPIGSLDCNGSGCHTTTNVNAGGFKLGTASLTSPTLTVAGHTTVAAAVTTCQTCHETAPYTGMVASTATSAGDSRPSAALDAVHPSTGDCGGCHTTIPTFANDQTGTVKPANHIPTTAACAQCHTTAGNDTLYSVVGTHQGVSGCLTCHGSTVATTFANVTIVTTSSSHMPIGSLDCNGSGCHTTTSVSPGGFKIGTASLTAPVLSVAGHTTVAAGVAACQTCHEAATYQGMIAGTASAWGDSRPSTFDKNHPTTGDCGGCHTTTPTFASDQTGSIKPANHIPTTAACAQCHTTAGNDAVYSVTGTHTGVTGCLTCHGPTVASSFANVTIVTTSSSHMPIGSLDCNGSGCHTTTNVNPGGFKIGTASLTSPTLTVAGHTTVAAGVAACQTCHETAPYQGMIAGTASAWGDSRPTAYDAAHPTTGDCGGCHTTTPTFSTDQTGNAKPANHIPTTAACAQCHTTAGNDAVYSVTGTHTGVTGCLTCHGPTVATTFANVTIVTTASNHIPIGSLDCNGSGCHTTTNVNPGGFKLGTASLTAPVLTVAGHTTIAAAVSGCQTCHETASYQGMIAGTASAWGDSRPTAFDAAHPTTGDCNGCHTTTPTFATNQSGSSAKPSNHIPTTAACAQCHTTAGNYALYVMGTTGHTGITNNCAQCHAYGLSFYNMAPPTLVQPPSGATGHIPSNPPNGATAIACELCHSPAAFTTFSGTVMKHATVTTMKCMSCHEYGMTWKTNTGVQLWVRDSPNHYAGQDCNGSGCHTARDKRAGRRPVTAIVRTPAAAPAGPFNHASVAGQPCASCHNGTAATGKPASHIATTSNCQSCHTTLAWLPVKTVDHSQVIGTCVSCHNGTTAMGKPSRHLATSAGCDKCHTTNAWVPARFDHAAVAPHTCNTCHNGVQAIGMPHTHIATTASCDTCHGTLAWTPALIDHSSFVGSCGRCHNNIAATGLPPSHFVTHLDCASCHSYPDWTVARFQHRLTADYPLDHRVALACTSCHTTNAEQLPYAAPSYAGTCAGCHARDFVAARHPKTLKGQLYTVGELANCSGACHVYSDATFTTIARSQPGPRHRVTDGRL